MTPTQLEAEAVEHERLAAEKRAQAAAMEPDKRKAAYQAYLDRLEPGCAGVDMMFPFYAGYSAAEHDLAPLAPAVGMSAEAFADYLAEFYDQRVGAWRSKVIRAIIERDRATLSRSARWPGEDELREMVDDGWHLMEGPRGKAVDAFTEHLQTCLRAHLKGDPA